MTVTDELSTKSLQLWPGGKSVTVRGSGDSMEICDGYRHEVSSWRKPTDEERRAVRIEELAEGYADRDIMCCDSCLVSDALANAWSRDDKTDNNGEWDWENVSNVYADPSNWSLEECKDWLEDKGYDLPIDPNPWTMDRAAIIAELEAVCIDCQEDEDTETLRTALIENINDETIDGLDQYRDRVRDVASDHQAEIYEWWRVTSWLADKLDAIGECVLKNAYGTWWGRTCTGQGLIMDGTLQRVAEEYA